MGIEGYENGTKHYSFVIIVIIFLVMSVEANRPKHNLKKKILTSFLSWIKQEKMKQTIILEEYFHRHATILKMACKSASNQILHSQQKYM
jgi:hypothetical protein